MKKGSLLAVLLIFCICCGKECKIDKDFNKIYYDSLLSIKTDYEEVGTPQIDPEKAFLFLGSITGHHSSRDGTHFGLWYQSDEDYLDDIKKWEKWYEENRCIYTIEKADSIYSEIKLPIKVDSNWISYLGKWK
jgi:hypothetical protein